MRQAIGLIVGMFLCAIAYLIAKCARGLTRASMRLIAVAGWLNERSTLSLRP